ncbi:hypothetical protein, partial [uncultured Cyclobacterium sp.]|uniref:hypothetical protein n=1 Tax=uncultured Cyclobacterium sp. TaxID=453820 RepID=UPI0030EDAF4B
FNRKQFNDTIDTRFSELGIPVVAEPSTFDPSLATVGDFFTIYNSLFYQIPKGTGNDEEVNTHSRVALETRTLSSEDLMQFKLGKHKGMAMVIKPAK